MPASTKLSDILRDWMLPIAIVTGISIYLIYHFCPALHPAGKVLHVLAAEGQKTIISILMFFQFVKVSPHDLRFRRWHVMALLFQIAAFIGFAALVYITRDETTRILLECAMLCLICPTASAAGVITEKLKGSLSETMSYLVLINTVATFLIPAVIPMVRPSDSYGFWQYVIRIGERIFPLLILPCLLAWLIRYTTHRLQRLLMRLSRYTFYIWGPGLMLAMVLSTRALLLSHLGIGSIFCIVLVSMGCCAVQFFAGRHFRGSRTERITAGQALGQKNTGFLIWLGYHYMTPVTSVAGGLYAIWQNLFNSWELYRENHPDTTSSR